ncbi:DUF3397 domain-containing protein [Neobacillus dielmonensis]|uniref:DUF3397 domain-containing protein n=1 Tax=Neobacillus dielmonensis TaxID=1347369 RepID=UPI0005AB769F|nr:DUF3397 domain-containing protein [Neobacillus dielmonensis]
MSVLLSMVLSVLFAMPFLGFFLVLLIFKMATKNTRKSFHKALDYSTVLFIIAVYFLMETIWQRSFTWLIFLVMIVTAMVLVILNWKIKQEIDLKRVVKGFWRFNFILFFTAYIALTLYGIVYRALVFTL